MVGSIGLLDDYWLDKSPFLREIANAMSSREPWCVDDVVIDRLNDFVLSLKESTSLNDADESDLYLLLGYLTSVNAMPLLAEFERLSSEITERLIVFGESNAGYDLFIERLMVLRSAGVLRDMYATERVERIKSFLALR